CGSKRLHAHRFADARQREKALAQRSPHPRPNPLQQLLQHRSAGHHRLERIGIQRGAPPPAPGRAAQRPRSTVNRERRTVNGNAKLLPMPTASPAQPRSALPWVLALAAATVLAHWLTGARYGFQRDELAALAQAAALVLTALMARTLGGGRRAQLIAAAAAVPFCLGGGALMQYVSFDYLAWALAAYCALRLFAGGNPRWWLAIGAAVGFGMLSKYTMPMLAAALGLGLLATPWRKHLKTPWLWAGVGVALLVFAPNLIWEARHHFITL